MDFCQKEQKWEAINDVNINSEIPILKEKVGLSKESETFQQYLYVFALQPMLFKGMRT